MKNIKNVKDITGKRFGRLTVIGLQPTESRKTYWVCQCDCGNMKIVRSDSLQCGAIRSCGCLKKEQDKKNLSYPDLVRGQSIEQITAGKKRHFIDGEKVGGTRLYEIWQGMKARCYNEHNARYDRYGGRGIQICPEWKDNFIAFHDWAIANGYHDDLTIDRIDLDGDYCPDNCRWATVKEQSNNRSTNINIKIGNATKTLMQWCEIFELDHKKIYARYKRHGFNGIDELFN